MRVRVAVIAMLAALAWVQSAGAADFAVTRGDDPVPDACAPGDCSLREAVIAANGSGDAVDRVLLPPGAYTLSLAGAGEDLAATGDLDLFTGDIEIRGTGGSPAATVVSAAGLGDRILDVLPFADARILNVTLRGGTETVGGAIRSVRELTIRRVAFEQNAATTNGGAIHSADEFSRATIEDSTFTGNTADRGGAIFNEDASTFVIARSTFSGNSVSDRGGAIFNQENGAVTLVESRLEGNRADAPGATDGGAIFTQNTSSFTIVRSALTGNRAAEAGGAIFVQNDSALSITDATIAGNTALGTDASEGGGAVYANNDSAVLIERSTLSGNRSEGDAGAVSRNNDGQLLLHNSTVSGNSAGGNGGGLVFDSAGGGGFIAVESSTVTGNTASGQGGGVFHEGNPENEAGFLNSIIAGNSAGGVANDCATDGVGILTSRGFNLDGTGTCGLGAAGDRPGANPMLGPLADNGGPTLTHALLAGSLAIDAGTTDPFGPSIDQRGVVRPQPTGGRRDIGAFELVGGAVAPPPPPAVALAASATCAGQRATIVGTPGNDVIVGTRGRDVIHALGGNDRVISRGGDDVICLGNGNDFANAGAGKDRVIGGRGADRIVGGSGNDILIGGQGQDRLFGGAGNDTLNGGAGPDILSGDSGNDALLGQGGSDVLLGGGDRDRSVGGAGRDTCRTEVAQSCERP